MLLLVYKPLHGLGLEFISDVFKEYKPSRALGSMGSGPLVEPRVQLVTDGQVSRRALAVDRCERVR